MKLDHIQLAMPAGGESEARTFFCEILGMTEGRKPAPLDERGGCWFRKDDVILHLGVEKEFVPQKKAHPAFLISDIHDLARRLEDENYEILWDEGLPNRKRFYSTDPFGNRLEFMQDGDGFSQK